MDSDGETPPPDAPSAHRDVFRPFRGFASAAVRPARAAESGVGAGREFPECSGKGCRVNIPYCPVRHALRGWIVFFYVAT